jgi:hypothetical protein
LAEIAQIAAEIPQDAQPLTGLWKSRREDFRPQSRPGDVLKLALIAILVFGLAAAAADLARGRRPVLFA